jgi:HEAT repeat protein
VRWRAAAAFAHIGETAVPRLIQVLNEEDWQVRTAAIYSLELIGDSRAVPALIGALHGRTTECRCMAAAALRKIGDPGGLAAVNRVPDLDQAGEKDFVDELTGRT